MVMAAAVAVQMALLWTTFPLSELFSAIPMLHADSAFHWYQMLVAKALWAEGRLVGFDPWFAAGHLGGVAYNASAKVPALLAALLPEWLGVEAAYKVYAALTAIVAPLCVVLALHLRRADPLTLLAGAVLGVLMFWVSALHWYFSVGMVSFVLAAFLALPYLALLERSATEPSRWWHLPALGLVGAVAVLNHPLFAVMVLFSTPVLIAAHWRELRWPQVAAIAVGVPAIIALCNLPWVLPTVQFPGWSDNALSPFQKAVDAGIIWNEALGRITDRARGARINPVLLLLSSAAWFAIAKSRASRATWAVSVGSAAMLMLFAAFGSLSGAGATFQPNRFSVVAFLLLSVPASHAVAWLMRRAWASGLPATTRAGAALVLLAAAALPARELAIETSQGPASRHGAEPPEVQGPGELTQWLESWIKQNTNDEARVLFETSLARVHDGGHVAGYLAVQTQREFIGGPYVHMHHAGFWDGTLFGRPVEAWTAEELIERLRLYNVRWIIVHSPRSQAVMAKLPGVAPRVRRGQIAIFELKGENSYFLQGSGSVSARRWNRLELSDIAGQSVVLKYHYLPWLRTEPAVRIEAFAVPGDPTPFVRLVDPPSRLVLTMK